MQSEEVIFSRFPNQFLIEGQGDDLTVGKVGSGTRPLQGVLDHAWSFHGVVNYGKKGDENCRFV